VLERNQKGYERMREKITTKATDKYEVDDQDEKRKSSQLKVKIAAA
jgi:hypothetical protein